MMVPVAASSVSSEKRSPIAAPLRPTLETFKLDDPMRDVSNGSK